MRRWLFLVSTLITPLLSKAGEENLPTAKELITSERHNLPVLSEEQMKQMLQKRDQLAPGTLVIRKTYYVEDEIYVDVVYLWNGKRFIPIKNS